MDESDRFGRREVGPFGSERFDDAETMPLVLRISIGAGDAIGGWRGSFTSISRRFSVEMSWNISLPAAVK